MRLAAFAVCAAAMASPAMVWAEDRSESIELDYAATGACPGRDEFASRVRARTARASFAPSGEAQRVFDVRLHEGRPANGRVIVRREGAVVGARDVRADTCSDVADALALVVALAVDPAALTAASLAPAPAPTPVAQPRPTPAPAASATSAAATPPAPVVSFGPPANDPRSSETLPEARDATSIPAPAATPSTLFVGTDLAASSGTVPSTLVAVSPYVGWRSATRSTIVPSVRLGFLRATTGVMALPGGSAAFTWTTGHADGCATLWPSRPGRLSACARVEGGVLDASGAEVPAPRSQTRGWLGIGPLARAEWSPIAPLFVEAELGAMVHVVTDRFYFLPYTTAYQVPLLGLCGSVGVGVYFL